MCKLRAALHGSFDTVSHSQQKILNDLFHILKKTKDEIIIGILNQ